MDVFRIGMYYAFINPAFIRSCSNEAFLSFYRRLDCMGTAFRQNLAAWLRKETIPFLASAWLLGLVSGSFFSVSAGNSFLLTMRAAASSHVSIFGLLASILLPLLFSAFAVYISQPWLLVPIAFGKAFFFSYLALAVLSAFGSAGWLIRWLLMFSDSLSLPVLWWYWLRAVSGRRKFADTAAAFLAALVIGSVDFYMISPVLANLKF